MAESKVATAERMGRQDPAWLELAGPVVFVCLAVAVAGAAPAAVGVQMRQALVSLVIVVGLQIFVGTSGVVSFGHIAFVAVGAWTFGLLTIAPELKANVMPSLAAPLADAHTPVFVAIVIAGLAAGLLGLLAGPFISRLHGLQAGIATLALLILVVQVLTYWSRIGPPAGQSMVGIQPVSGLTELLVAGVAAMCASWWYQRSRSAMLLRASRESLLAAAASGISVVRHRTIAFVLSAAVCGVGGALWARVNVVVQASEFSIGFTFVVVAMLVLGGMLSMWGGVVGVMVYSGIDQFLLLLQSGVDIGGLHFMVGEEVRPLVLGVVIVVMLIVRPDGLTGGVEFRLPGYPPGLLGRRSAVGERRG